MDFLNDGPKRAIFEKEKMIAMKDNFVEKNSHLLR